MWQNSTQRNAPAAEIPECLCKKVMGRFPVRPRLGHTRETQEYVMYCPSCNMHTYPSTNKQSVIAEWCGMNRSGDQQVEQLWVEKYHRLQPVKA